MPIAAVGSDYCCNRIQEGQAVLGLGGGYIEKSAAFASGDNGKGVAAKSGAREAARSRVRVWPMLSAGGVTDEGIDF